MTAAGAETSTFRAVLVREVDAAVVARNVEEYGPVAASFWGAEGRYVVPVLGPVDGWTVVLVPDNLDDVHLLNLTTWLTGPLKGRELTCTVGWCGARGATGPGLLVERDPHSGGELLRGLRAGGRPYHADLMGGRPALPPEVGASPQHQVPHELGSWLAERQVPPRLQALGAALAQLPRHADVRLECRAKERDDGVLETTPPTVGSRIAAALGVLVFAPITAFVSFMSRPPYSDTLASQVMSIALAVSMGLVALQSLGVLLLGGGRPYYCRFEPSGKLFVRRVVLFWRTRVFLDAREVAKVRLIYRGRSTAAGPGWLDLRDRRGRRLVRITAMHAPGDSDVFLAALMSVNPDLVLERVMNALGNVRV